MPSLFLRPAGLALFFGLIAFAGSAAEAANIGANLNIRTQNFPQTVYSAGGRQPNVGLGPSTTPPAVYGGAGPHRPHLFDRDTQFDGMTDTSASGKPLK
jgi:hypothetical protein